MVFKLAKVKQKLPANQKVSMRQKLYLESPVFSYDSEIQDGEIYTYLVEMYKANAYHPTMSERLTPWRLLVARPPIRD